MGQSKVSYHMKKLKDAGLLHEERRGKWAFYSLNREAGEELLGEVRPDIHSNLPALETVLEDIDSQEGVDAIYDLGDLGATPPGPTRSSPRYESGASLVSRATTTPRKQLTTPLRLQVRKPQG
jgi:hypothetical protein